ncbi:MAG TPA: FAD-binding protein [Lapillicoccus sp.]|nr:FAD-binding protein [Lapillicoccus sp.]
MSVQGPDLVIAGAGGGLAGALRAAELGLDVLVVEVSEHFRRGNNTSMSTAMVPGAGTRFQRAEGIDDSPELYLADIEAKTHGEASEQPATALTEVSGRLVEWLVDHVGLDLHLVTDFHYPGHSVDRCHTIEGRHGTALLDHLVHRVRDTEGVDLLVPARLVDVRLDDDGRVAAVVLESPDGSTEEVPTRAVLLATNGYGADHALVAEHMPEIADAVYHGSEASRGDALRIGRDLGARTAFLDAYQGHGALAQRTSTLVGWATVMHGAVIVGADGRRFGNETSGYSEYAAVIASQPGAAGWIIFDQRIHDACLVFTDFRQTVDGGALVWADDVPGLAEATGLPADALAEELAATAAQASESGADRFGRTSFEAPLEPPYAAVKVVPALFHTQGGLVVDGSARVLREDGTPIEGLYASGGAAAGISGHGAAGYLAGNGLLPALGLAFLAAEHAAGIPTTTETTPRTPTVEASA